VNDEHLKDGHVMDAAQGVAKDVAQGLVQDLAFEARAARTPLVTPPPPPPPSLRSSRLAEMGAQLDSSVALGWGCMQALPGVPGKAPQYS